MQRRYTSDEAGSLHYMSSVKLQKQLSTFKHAPRDLIRCCIPSTVSARPSAIMRALGFPFTSTARMYVAQTCSTRGQQLQHVGYAPQSVSFLAPVQGTRFIRKKSNSQSRGASGPKFNPFPAVPLRVQAVPGL